MQQPEFPIGSRRMWVAQHSRMQQERAERAGQTGDHGYLRLPGACPRPRLARSTDTAGFEAGRWPVGCGLGRRPSKPLGTSAHRGRRTAPAGRPATGARAGTAGALHTWLAGWPIRFMQRSWFISPRCFPAG
jgi:hypothetical protein